MSKFQVIDPDQSDDWDDATPFVSDDARSAAELFAEHQCHKDNDCYSKYLEGHELFVCELGRLPQALTTVIVFVREEPVFTSRVKRLPEPA